MRTNIAFCALCIAGFYFADANMLGIAGVIFGLAGYLAGRHDAVDRSRDETST